eukprot:3141719-Rhodomonas_salina.1
MDHSLSQYRSKRSNRRSRRRIAELTFPLCHPYPPAWQYHSLCQWWTLHSISCTSTGPRTAKECVSAYRRAVPDTADWYLIEARQGGGRWRSAVPSKAAMRSVSPGLRIALA